MEARNRGAVRATIEPTKVQEREGKTIVTATPAGNFSGNPVGLKYEFTIVGGAIKVLGIRP